MPKFKTRS